MLQHLCFGAALLAVLAFSGPAQAKVDYDLETHSGFVDRADVRDALGWTDEELTAGALTLTIGHVLNIEETYAATCGRHTFRWIYPIQHTTHELTATPAYEGTELTGFGLTRGLTAASSRRVSPMAGDDCSWKTGQPADAKIDALCFESSSTAWGLRMRSGDVSEYVELHREPSPPRPKPLSKYVPPDCPAPA